MTDVITETLEKNLALDVACGNSVRRWARRHGVDFKAAYEHSIQKPFREIVDTTRLRIADRFVGKLTSAAPLAIAQLVKLCTRSKSDSIRLSASRTLLGFWMQVHRYFDQWGQLQEVKEAAVLLSGENNTGEWIPHSPSESSPLTKVIREIRAEENPSPR